MMVLRIALLLMVLMAPRLALAFEAKEVISPSGIKAWLVEDHTVPLITLNFSIAAGSASDPIDKEGISSFVAAMLNEGAGSYDGPGFQAKLEDLAIGMSFDVTVDRFQGNLQTIAANQDQAFELLRLALNEATFPETSTERVRQQMLLAARNALFNPGSIAANRHAALSFPGHFYARDSGGTQLSVSLLKRDEIAAHSRLMLHRNGLIVSAVGDISAAELGKALDTVFGGLPAGEAPVKVPDVDMAAGPVLEVIDFDTPQTLFLFGHRGIRIDDPGYVPAFVMTELLGGSFQNSWLSQELREKRGLTYGVSFDIVPMTHAGFFQGGFSTSNATAKEALEVAKATIRRMAEQGPSEQELNDVKTYLTGSYPLRFDNTRQIAGFLTGLQLVGRPIDYAEKRNALVEAVTLEQVKEQAKRLLKPDGLVVVAVGKPEGLK